MLSVAAELARAVPLESRPRVAVALSGGVDSTALLRACCIERAQFAALRALHVNHGLMPRAAEWECHCRALARRWRVPFRALRIAASMPAGASLEQWARQQRYAAIAATLGPGEVLITAQHQDDQAETLLLQLLRGSGVAGLAAMPRVAALGAGWLVRPWLDRTRAEIEAFARAERLVWIDDSSNRDVRLARAYLRQRVMPALRERWPTVTATLARSAGFFAEARELLDSLAAQDRAQASDGDGLSVPRLRAMPMARRKNLIRSWIAERGCRSPDATRLNEIAGALLAARDDAQPRVEWETGSVRRSAGRIDVVPRTPRARATDANAPDSRKWRWSRARRVRFGAATLELRADAHGPIDLALVPRLLEVRRRRGGERLRPRAGGPSRTVKFLLQSARISTEERAAMPLVFGADKLLMVGDRWADASILATARSRMRARLVIVPN